MVDEVFCKLMDGKFGRDIVCREDKSYPECSSKNKVLSLPPWKWFSIIAWPIVKYSASEKALLSEPKSISQKKSHFPQRLAVKLSETCRTSKSEVQTNFELV